jgi:hypothetical protein
MVRSHDRDDEDQEVRRPRKSLATGRYASQEGDEPIPIFDDDPPELNAFLMVESKEDMEKFLTNHDVDFMLKVLKSTKNTIIDWDGQLTIAFERATLLEEHMKEKDTELIEKEGALKMLQKMKLTGNHGGAKSTKAPDPTPFSNGEDPSYNHWKLQMQGKFTINEDHFQNEKAKMIYFFNRTAGDAAEHLQPRYENDASEPFETVEQMFSHLDAIYLDPFEKENAKKAFKKLAMTEFETFPKFLTRFLHLSGKAKIPKSELIDELCDKLTISLAEAILSSKNQYDVFDKLAKQLAYLDNEQRFLRARKIQQARAKAGKEAGPTKNANAPSTPASTTTYPRNSVSITPTHGILKTNTPTSGQSSNYQTPTYNDPAKQETSKKGLCHNCGKPGHFYDACTEPPNPNRKVTFKTEVKEIDVEASEDDMSENGQA